MTILSVPVLTPLPSSVQAILDNHVPAKPTLPAAPQPR